MRIARALRQRGKIPFEMSPAHLPQFHPVVGAVAVGGEYPGEFPEQLASALVAAGGQQAEHHHGCACPSPEPGAGPLQFPPGFIRVGRGTGFQHGLALCQRFGQRFGDHLLGLANACGADWNLQHIREEGRCAALAAPERCRQRGRQGLEPGTHGVLRNSGGQCGACDVVAVRAAERVAPILADVWLQARNLHDLMDVGVRVLTHQFPRTLLALRGLEFENVVRGQQSAPVPLVPRLAPPGTPRGWLGRPRFRRPIRRWRFGRIGGVLREPRLQVSHACLQLGNARERHSEPPVQLGNPRGGGLEQRLQLSNSLILRIDHAHEQDVRPAGSPRRSSNGRMGSFGCGSHPEQAGLSVVDGLGARGRAGRV